LGGDKYYCGHCWKDRVDHTYDTCPLWLVCIFCLKTGHLGYACPDPHCSCNTVSYCVLGDQPNIGDFCPMSHIHCLTAWGQSSEELGDWDMGESFFKGADWDSFHVD
jgi:hypothetical protein